MATRHVAKAEECSADSVSNIVGPRVPSAQHCGECFAIVPSERVETTPLERTRSQVDGLGTCVNRTTNVLPLCGELK